MAKVYVIDDSMSVCFAIERMLRARGMEVVTEQSGAAALGRLEDVAPDLVLCDLVLPDLEGFEICRFLRAHPALGEVPIIVISGIVDDSVRAEAQGVGAVGVLKKPFATDDLVELVEKVLGAAQRESARARAADATLPRLSEPRFDQLEDELAPLAGLESLRFACLLTPDGDLRGFGAHKPEADEMAHVPELLRFASAASGRVGHGQVDLTTIEGDDGILVILPWHADCVLAVGLGHVATLGKARYMLRRMAAGLPLPGWT